MAEPESNPIPQTLFDSELVEAGHAFEAWAQRVRGWDIGLLNAAEAAPFKGTASAWLMGEAVLALGDFATASTQVRQHRHVRADQMDHYKLVLIERANFRSDLDGQRVILERTDQILITDLARPEAVSVQGRWIEFYLPRDALDGALPHPMDLHGVVLDGWAVPLLANHLRAMLREIGRIGIDSVPLLTRAAVHLLVASLTAADRQVSMAMPVVQATLLRQLCNFVDLHLTDPDFSPEQICRAFQMSRSALYRLFEPLGGVASFVRDRRLERIHALLTHADRKTYVSRLALDHGFKNTTHFTRVFRERFGYSPSAALEHSAAALTPSLRAVPTALEGLLEGLRARSS